MDELVFDFSDLLIINIETKTIDPRKIRSKIDCYD